MEMCYLHLQMFVLSHRDFFFITFTHEGAVWYYKANALLKLLVFIGI